MKMKIEETAMGNEKEDEERTTLSVSSFWGEGSCHEEDEREGRRTSNI